MRFNRRSASLVAAAVSVVMIALTQPPTASATSAGSVRTQTIESGSIIVFASAAQTFTNTGVAATIDVKSDVAHNFWINNSGSEALSQFTITVTLPANANVSAFRRCDLNVSFIGKNTCASGAVSNFALTPGVAKTFVATLPSMGFYSFQIIQSKKGSMTVSTSVFSNHILGTVDNS